MEPIHSIKRILIWLCMCTADKSSSIWLKRAHFVFALITFILTFSGFAAHVAYMYEYLSVDLDGSMFAFLGLIGFTDASFIMIIIVFFLRHKISILFDTLSEIYDASK